MSEDLEGHLGLILGAAAGGLHRIGISDQEIHRWVDLALGTARLAEVLGKEETEEADERVLPGR